MEAGAVVRVLKDFFTTADGELCVPAGDYLQVRVHDHSMTNE